MTKQKNPPDKGRLGDFVLPDKEAVNKSLNDFKNGVKGKEETELILGVFFEQMRRFNLGVK